VLDSRSDIYSLGCVMYESLTGSLPFQHDNILKIIFAQVNDNAAPFANIRPELGIPLALEEIIFKCLNKNPHDRYQSARELCEELWEFAASGKATKARLSATQQVRALRSTVPETPPVPDHGPTQLNEAMVRQALSSDRMPALKPSPSAQNVAPSQVQSAQNMPALNPSPPAQNVAPSQVQSAQNMPAFNPSPPAQNVAPSQVQSAQNVAPSQVQSAQNMPAFNPSPPAQNVAPSQVQSAQNMPAFIPGTVPPPPPAAGVPPIPQGRLQTTFNPIPAPDVVPGSKAAEENALSGLALRLLLRSGVISEDLLRVVADCVQTIENGDITLEQAVSIIHHATGKHKMD
jgi:serine/threonine protein kinase